MPQTPVFRAAGSVSFTPNNVSTPATLTPGAPAGKTVGDVLFLVCFSRSIVGTVATPTGWSLVTGFPKRSGTASGGSFYLFTRVADGTATDTPSPVWASLGSTGTTGDSCSAVILCYTNAASVTLDAGTIVVSDLSAQGSTSAITGMTTSSPNSLVLSLAAKIIDFSGANSATYTERVDAATTSGTGHGLEYADEIQVAAGASGTDTVTWGTTTSARVFGVTVAFVGAALAGIDAATITTNTTPSGVDVKSAIIDAATVTTITTISGIDLSKDVVRVGGVITDATRYVEGDGFTIPDSSYGLWRDSTNLVINGGFETNTSNWGIHNTATISRVTSDSKFGSACCQVSLVSANDGIDNASTPITISPSTVYSLSAWVKCTSGKTIFLGESFSGTTTTVTSTGNWQRITLKFTSQVSQTQAIVVIINQTDNTTFFVDGIQLEQQPYATPYIETNGASANRALGYVSAPASLLDKIQSWVAVRFRIEDLNTALNIQHHIIGFGILNDSNNGFILNYDAGSERLEFISKVGGVNFSIATASFSPSAGSTHTFIVTWTASTVKVSVDGGNFSSHANSTITSTYDTFRIGQNMLGTLDTADGEFLWVACGTGTLSDADAASIDSKGDTDDATNWPSLSAPTMFWPANNDAYVIPTVAVGTAYTESATITTTTTPSATDVAAYVESAIISSITTPSASEIYTPSGIAYTDAATIVITTSVTRTETAQFTDSSQITTVSSISSSDVSAYVDLNTVSTVSGVISSDVLAAIEAATVVTITTPISAELHEIFDSATITGTTTPSSTELHEIPDSSSITGTTTVTTLDTAQYVDASTTGTTTTPISTDIAQYVDAATTTTTTTTTPSTTDVVVVIDASTATTITVVSSADIAVYLDAETLTTKTTVTSAELREIPDSSTISGTTFVTTLDTAQYVDANKPTAITTPSADEQQSGATADTNTLRTITSITYTETAQYVDAGTATSTTSVSTTDVPIYGDSGTVPTTSTPTSADVVIYIDAATAPITTTPSAVEVGAFTDSATLTTLTSISYVDVPIYGDSNSLLTTTTPTSADVVEYTDLNTATTITSLSALETKTSGNTDFATVTTITYIITVREGIFLLVDLIPSPLLARWYNTTTLTSRYPVRVFQKWAAGLLTNRYNMNDYKKWVTSWIR